MSVVLLFGGTARARSILVFVFCELEHKYLNFNLFDLIVIADFDCDFDLIVIVMWDLNLKSDRD